VPHGIPKNPAVSSATGTVTCLGHESKGRGGGGLGTGLVDPTEKKEQENRNGEKSLSSLGAQFQWGNQTKPRKNKKTGKNKRQRGSLPLPSQPAPPVEKKKEAPFKKRPKADTKKKTQRVQISSGERRPGGGKKTFCPAKAWQKNGKPKETVHSRKKKQNKKTAQHEVSAQP